MDVIIAVIFVILLAIVTGLSMYVILKKDDNVRTSENILYHFKDKCEDNLDDLIEFSKKHKFKYKI